MKIAAILVSSAMLVLGAHAAPAVNILFIGNSFTFGAGSPVRTYRPDTVTDLNKEGIGGVPALFKSFTTQAGLAYDVSLETHPGVGLDYHLQSKLDVIGSRPWDVVVMHGFSTLDAAKPGDPAKLIATTRQMVEFLRERNPKAEIHLTATWSRADLTYVAGAPWFGKPIEAMARDVRVGYDKAAAAAPAVKSVIPVGEAFTGQSRQGWRIQTRMTASSQASSICGPPITITPAPMATTSRRWSCSATSRSAIRVRWATTSAPRTNWA